MLVKKILILVLAGVILFSASSCARALGKKAPNFSLEDTNHATVRLSDYENDVIILNFFATWCPPCRTEIPDFVELVDDYGDRDLTIIGISVDRGGVEVLNEFIAEYNINYPVLLDDGIVSDEYGPIRSIPATFIIDRKGNIVEKIIGSRTKDYFERLIKPLL